jgi:hypothetical protein
MSFVLSFKKSDNRRVGKVLSEGVVTSGRRKDVEKGCKRVTIVKILCTHICK